MSAPCEFLDWDTNFFGINIARVSGHNINERQARRIMNWCKDNKVDCLYYLCDPANNENIRLAEHYGGRFVDVRVTLERRIDGILTLFSGSASKGVRIATPEDVPVLREIAAQSYHDTRFYRDPGFSREKCSELYALWIEKSCGDWADCVLVSEDEGKILGFITCHIDDPISGRIGLLGVSDTARNRGVGQRIVADSLRWFAEQGVENVTVVTQGINYRAQRLYQRCGFITRSIDVWYHFWFSDNTSG